MEQNIKGHIKGNMEGHKKGHIEGQMEKRIEKDTYMEMIYTRSGITHERDVHIYARETSWRRYTMEGTVHKGDTPWRGHTIEGIHY